MAPGELKVKRKKKKKRLAAIPTQGTLTETALLGEACTELPACTVFPLSEPASKTKFLESYFNQ